MKKPNLFILGAPKCGTTSLSAWLTNHPQVYMSPVKEPNYFNYDFNKPYQLTLSEYEKLFSSARKHHKIAFESSSRYLFSRVAVQEIIKYKAHAKFIAIIRNPVDLVISLHNHLLSVGIEHENDLEKAWELQHSRKHGYNISRHCTDPDSLQYREIALLGDQLERLYQYASNDSVTVLLLDDLKSNPSREYKKILNMIEVDEILPEDYPIMNSSFAPRNRLLMKSINVAAHVKRNLKINSGLGILKTISSLNRKAAPKAIISTRLRQRLIDSFKDDISKIEQVTNRDLSHWLG